MPQVWKPPAEDDREYIDLFDVLPDAQVSFDRDYWVYEQKFVTPALEELGYTVRRWVTGDGDSFGPLTRYAVCEKDGKIVRLIYG